ncbi:MAG: hypothetical protein KDC52_13090 [Ignavibacteriae bacterium]|nr:hypothetical protein [Ignavibacteriota bacterium]
MKEELLNKIISVAYGDASLKDKISIYFLAKKDGEVKNLLNEYKHSANTTHNLGFEECPDNIIEKVTNSINSKTVQSKSMLTDIYSIIFRRPVFSGAVLGVIMMAVISTFIFNRPEIKQQYTKQQIELADEQVKQSFALVASVLNKTKNTVEKEVLTDRVSRPIKQSFNLVNEYLKGENKNENIN